MDRAPQDPVTASPPADDTASSRNQSRDSLLLVAGFRLRGEASIAQVRVRNLSAGGLMAEYGDYIATGTEIEVEVRGIGWISGHIAWTAVGRVGVAFDHQIDPLKARKPVGRGAKKPGFVKTIAKS
ncbi:PilZ domain-containing protein [Sphingomonas koreensis]|nr:PilZ domain-containing protein [Sphingomonas koreensis]